jgi:hypothetical protein
MWSSTTSLQLDKNKLIYVINNPSAYKTEIETCQQIVTNFIIKKNKIVTSFAKIKLLN